MSFTAFAILDFELTKPLTMFKGLISSKRISSEDFTIVAGPGITRDPPYDDKENKPDVSVVQQQSAPKIAAKPMAPKAFGKASEKYRSLKSKEKMEEPRGQQDQVAGMEDAFDKLLVSVDLLILLRIWVFSMHYIRMTSRFHQLYDQNWQQWTRPSKSPC